MSGFEALYKKSKAPVLSATERRKAEILIVDSDPQIRQTMRQSLMGLGFGTLSDAPDHVVALEKIEDRHFTHIIFEAKSLRISAKEFLSRALELDPQMVTLPASYEPTVDDVFDLLIQGARGFIVKPFTAESLDIGLIMATKGEPISDAVLNARNRNEALAALILSSLDKLAVLMRQAGQFETAKRELPKRALGLRRSVDLGNTFAKGGPLMLRETLIDLCIERSNGPASRLGRFRKRIDIKKKRGDRNRGPSQEEAQASKGTEDETQEEAKKADASTESVTL